jgi:hypothetical protein
MSSPPAEDPATLIADLEIGDQPFLTAAYWETARKQGLEGLYRAATGDVQDAVGDWSHICRLRRDEDRYTVVVDDHSLALPRTEWTKLSLLPARSRAEQLPAQKYAAVLDRQGDHQLDVTGSLPQLTKPDAVVRRRQVPSFTNILVDGDLFTDGETIARIDVHRDRLLARIAEALALHPVAVAELDVLCELSERLPGESVRFVE